MQRNLNAFSSGAFDLLVIGGGIFGAGVARDAAIRGLRVALVEQNDFASGTSSQSSKLIHGGFRYLEQRDFRLVAESCRERRILRDIAPHRIKPLPLLLPVYKHDSRPLWMLRIGMTIYDLLAMYRNVAPHQTLSAAAAGELEPGLPQENLRGAIRFYDCQEDDARFCVDNVIDAAGHGAVCANYCKVTGFRSEGSRIVAARVAARPEHMPFIFSAAPSDGRTDGRRLSPNLKHEPSQRPFSESMKGEKAFPVATGEIAGDIPFSETFEIRARVFVNAAGPWVERVAGLITDPSDPRPRLSPTKGVHLLLPPLTKSHGIFFQNRRDQRMMFVLPWNDCTLVGTTDTDFAGDPSAVQTEAGDVDYLLDAIRGLFPSSNLSSANVIATTAGIRPLLASLDASPSARSREHQILRMGQNLLSLAGGKYTTYRLIAEQTVDAVYQILGSKPSQCRTATLPIIDARPAAHGQKLADSPTVYASDVEHAVRNEMACTLEDIMRRRTGLSLSRFGGAEAVQKIQDIVRRGESPNS